MSIPSYAYTSAVCEVEVVSSETAISGPRKSDGMPSPTAPAATSNRPMARSVPFTIRRRASSKSSGMPRSTIAGVR